MNFSDLKNKHKNEDIWVIASGSSLDFIKKSFFKNKTTIAVNRACNHFKCDYVVAKDNRGFESISKNSLNKNIQKIYTEWDCGQYESFRNDETPEEGVIYFPHPNNRETQPPLEFIGAVNYKREDFIIVSLSTITSAIHIAAHMGAKNIIICGHDCGYIENKTAIKNYNSEIKNEIEEKEFLDWLSKIENQTIAVCKRIKEVYNCNIHSLNPFINFNLEGFKFNSNSNINERRF